MEGFQGLHVGEALEKYDALDDFVGMLHLFDRFLAPSLGEHPVTPIVQKTVVQPILINRSKLVAKRFVEIVDNGRVTFHVAGPLPLLYPIHIFRMFT